MFSLDSVFSRADMKFDPALLRTIANTTGFPPDNLEKLLRLRELLTEFHKHPFLRNRLVLKGGTAINLFYLDLARLSVDIDLNCIAQVDREKMLAERPDVVRAVEQKSRPMWQIRFATQWIKRTSGCMESKQRYIFVTVKPSKRRR
jgi:predicted nucleotidyltransferase component of viral defense system